MSLLIFSIILFLAVYFSIPLLLNKNRMITEKFNIRISNTAVKLFYGISAALVSIIVCGTLIINSMVTEKSVQAVNIHNNVKGINISNNDGDIDLSSVSQADGEYVYLKATEGATFKDEYMDTYYKQCKKLGMKVGVYHYLVSTSTPEEQADSFYEMISKYNWDLIPMLDTEVYFDGLEEYIIRFKREFNRLSSMKLGIYTYTSFIKKYLNNCDSEIYDMPLWEANYNGRPWNDVGSNKFKQLVGHQYSTKIHIGEYIGSFNGDINEFNEGCLIDSWK